MRKATILIMAVALVLGLAQCKKNTDIVPVQSGTTTITLKVSGDNKLSVNPNTGTVGFTKGDVIYVVSGGKYCGTLVHGGENFSGTIAGAVAGKLYFYFLGNKTPSESLTSGSTGTFTVSIYDQTENYPVISVGVSTEDYDAGTTTYTSKLLNQCALVKFNVVTSSLYAPTIITGVNDKLVITLAAGGIGTFTTSQERGAVKMAGGSGERWAILFPQSATGVGAAYSADLSYRGMHGELPAITENDYLTNGINVNVNTRNEFTVASDGRKVRFSQGNLQYQASTNTWRFAENQYDFVGNGASTTGNVAGSTNANPTALYNGWIDLFGFGTSGWNSGANAYVPYSTSTTNSDYWPGNSSANNLTGDYEKADWGVYNGSAITNNYGTTSWRTLTGGADIATAEWLYLLTERPASEVNGIKNACYVPIAVKYNGSLNVRGILLFPDSFTWPSSLTRIPDGNRINVKPSSSWSTELDVDNLFTVSEFALLEAAGAVFLPAAGYRGGGSVGSAGSNGYYWSSTANGSDIAYGLNFYGGDFNPSSNNDRYNGRSVRLVSVLY